MKILDHPLLTDENIDPQVVEALRKRGLDIQTVLEAGLGGAGDERILEHARGEGRVVLTHDGDFGELAVRQGRGFIGIVYLRPGHIRAPVVLESIDAIGRANLDATPAFVAVAVRTVDYVRVRLKTVSPPG